MVVGTNLVSPVVEPCPEDAPGIPLPGLLSAAFDLFVDECVSVAGVVVWRDLGQVVVEIDRGEYWLRVLVQGSAGDFEQVVLGERVLITGRIRKHEEWGYAVYLAVDRGWWGNLLENLPSDFVAP